jgi:hypothetical protein
VVVGKAASPASATRWNLSLQLSGPSLGTCGQRRWHRGSPFPRRHQRPIDESPFLLWIPGFRSRCSQYKCQEIYLASGSTILLPNSRRHWEGWAWRAIRSGHPQIKHPCTTRQTQATFRLFTGLFLILPSLCVHQQSTINSNQNTPS